VVSIGRKEVSLREEKMLVPCEIRSKTESPCHRRAVVEMRGVALCGPCAREQEAYFAIGELTQEDETQGSGSKLLVEELKRLRGKRTDSTEGTASGMHHRLSSLEETESLALTNG
jgi:hypothetical protein